MDTSSYLTTTICNEFVGLMGKYVLRNYKYHSHSQVFFSFSHLLCTVTVPEGSIQEGFVKVLLMNKKQLAKIEQLKELIRNKEKGFASANKEDECVIKHEHSLEDLPNSPCNASDCAQPVNIDVTGR